MGQIIVPVTVSSVFEPGQSVTFDALVDTGADYLVLPASWRGRFGTLKKTRDAEAHLADGKPIRTELAGPLLIEIAGGFLPVHMDVIFLEMAEDDAHPLLGHFVLQQAQATVDMQNHCLRKVPYISIKRAMSV